MPGSTIVDLSEGLVTESRASPTSGKLSSPTSVHKCNEDDKLESPGGSSSSSDSHLDKTVIETTPLSKPNPKIIVKKGRRSKAETLVDNPDQIPSLFNFVQLKRGEKRGGDGLTKTPSTIKKNKQSNQVSPESDDNTHSFCPQQLFKPTSPEDSSDLSPVDADIGEMNKVLEAINNLDAKLSNITADIKKVSEDSTELKMLYGTLDKKLQENDQKHEEKYNKIAERLEVLESQYKLHPSNISAEEVRNEIRQQVEEQVSEVLSSGQDNSGVKLKDELATKINRALESLDSYERRLKKLNVVVKGLDPELLKSPQSIKRFLKSKYDADINIVDVKISTQTLMATVSLADWETKQKVLKNKGRALAGSNIYIDPDLTPREQRIAGQLRKIVREKKMSGMKAKIGYQTQSALINGNWYGWDECNECLKPLPARSHQQGNRNTKLSNILSEQN